MADVALFLDIALLPTALVIVANVLGVFAHDPSMGGGGSMQLPVLTDRKSTRLNSSHQI